MIEKIKRYYELKELESEIKAEKDLLNQEIKEWMMTKVKKDNCEIEDYDIRIQYIDHRKFDDSIIPFLKLNGFGDIVKTKEVFDYEKLKRIIKSNKIDSRSIERFRNKNGKVAINLYVKKIKNV